MKRNLGLTAAFRQAKWLAALMLTLAALALSLGLDLSGAIQPYRLKTLDALFRRLPFFRPGGATPPNPSGAALLTRAGLATPARAPGAQPAYKAVITPIPPLL